MLIVEAFSRNSLQRTANQVPGLFKLRRGIKLKSEENELGKLFEEHYENDLSLKWRKTLLSKKAETLKSETKYLTAKEEYEKNLVDVQNQAYRNSLVKASNQRLVLAPKEDYQISKSEYRKLVNTYESGRANVINYKDAKLSFVSTYFSGLNLSSLYSILAVTKPDLILMQLRPDSLLKNFVIKDPSEEKFDEDKYFEQLVRKPWDVMPNGQLRAEMKESIGQLGGRVTPRSGLSNEYLTEYARALTTKYRPIVLTECLDERSVAAVSFFAEMEGTPVVLGDIPEITHKSILANQSTRYQLANILKMASKETVYNRKVQPSTPWNMACRLFPELMLEPSDKYMAGLVDKCVSKGYKNILILQGGAQSVLTPKYLLYKIYSQGLIEGLQIPEWRVPAFQYQFVEDVLEKFTILDVMQHGPTLFQRFEDISFRSSYSIIDKYLDPEAIQAQRDELKYLHARQLDQYFKEMQQTMAEAMKELEKLYISEAQ